MNRTRDSWELRLHNRIHVLDYQEGPQTRLHVVNSSHTEPDLRRYSRSRALHSPSETGASEGHSSTACHPTRISASSPLIKRSEPPRQGPSPHRNPEPAAYRCGVGSSSPGQVQSAVMEIHSCRVTKQELLCASALLPQAVTPYSANPGKRPVSIHASGLWRGARAPHIEQCRGTLSYMTPGGRKSSSLQHRSFTTLQHHKLLLVQFL